MAEHERAGVGRPVHLQRPHIYRAGAGSYRIALFNERDPRLGGEVGNDVNRDGNPAGSSGIFAVLWNATSNLVWVDTNQNDSFADQAAMTDYKVRFDVGYFGVDNPATAIAERMPFVVQTDGKNKVVNIGIVVGRARLARRRYRIGQSVVRRRDERCGAGRQAGSVRACLFIAGCTNHALIEGMIYAVKSARVDVINMSIGGLPALNDGNNARAEIYNRLIEQYKVQMFFSAGNSGPGMNTVGDPSVATSVVSVGLLPEPRNHAGGLRRGHAVRRQPARLHLERPPRRWRVQAADRRPGAAVSSTRHVATRRRTALRAAARLPVDERHVDGRAAGNRRGCTADQRREAGWSTVQAGPVAPGNAALRPGCSTRRRLGIYRQGNGLVQTGAAWSLLATNISTDEIVARVPVNTVLSQFLAQPGIGVGIYDREGVTRGSRIRARTRSRARRAARSRRAMP